MNIYLLNDVLSLLKLFVCDMIISIVSLFVVNPKVTKILNIINTVLTVTNALILLTIYIVSYNK